MAQKNPPDMTSGGLTQSGDKKEVFPVNEFYRWFIQEIAIESLFVANGFLQVISEIKNGLATDLHSNKVTRC